MSELKLVRGLGEQIVERLRDDIFSGRIREGDRLRETELATRFEVSRGPIREAIQQLTWEGIVETDRNKGALVSSPAPNEITELLIPIRCTLEIYAVRLFFDQLTAQNFQTWDQILNKMKVACDDSDTMSTAEHDLAFHRSLVNLSNSKDLIAIWTSIVARVRNHFRESHSRYKDFADIHKEHLTVVEALRSGDLNKALAAIEKHIC